MFSGFEHPNFGSTERTLGLHKGQLAHGFRRMTGK